MTYKCPHCSRTIATSYALKRHISNNHQYNINEDEDKEAAIQSNMPNEEPGLWDEDFIMNSEVSKLIIIIMKSNLIRINL
jgi:hypothetical protein